MAKRTKNEASLKDLIDAYLDLYKLKSRVTQEELTAAWPEIMGPSIAKHTTELYLAKGILIIRLDSSVLRQELTYGKDAITRNINKHFNREVVKEVVLR